MFRRISHFLSLIKFSHTIFAMPFAIIGFVAGLKTIYWNLNPALGWWVLLCMIFARSAAMAFNRWADRHIDAINARTAGREIPAGIISANAALTFTIVMSAGFVFSAFMINPICFMLSPVALTVVLGYSYTKRFTFLSHLVLGLGLSLAPVGAYIAVTGYFSFFPIIIGSGVMCWVGGFDIIYALQDAEFDKTNSLNSIPAFFGFKGALLFSRVLHLFSALLLLLPYMLEIVGIWNLLGWFTFSGMLVYQHRIVSGGNLSRINVAFFTANGIASLVFMVFAVLGLLFY